MDADAWGLEAGGAKWSLEKGWEGGKVTVLERAPRMNFCEEESLRRAGKMWGSGVREMVIMAQKRVEASIWGRGGMVVVFGEEDAPRSWSVGLESVDSAFRLTGSPRRVGFSFARSLRLLGGFCLCEIVGDGVPVEDEGCAPLS